MVPPLLPEEGQLRHASPNLPDTPETRLDMAAFQESARSLDRGVGAVLDALDAEGLTENTLVICTPTTASPSPAPRPPSTTAASASC